MKNFAEKIKEMAFTVNFDGIRCLIKGDPSIREIMGALKRQDELKAHNDSVSCKTNIET